MFNAFEFFDAVLTGIRKLSYIEICTIPFAMDYETGIRATCVFYINGYDSRKYKILTNDKSYNYKNHKFYSHVIHPFKFKGRTVENEFADMDSAVASLLRIAGFSFKIGLSDPPDNNIINTEKEGNVIYFPRSTPNNGSVGPDE